jgi:chromosome segregation ATPase
MKRADLERRVRELGTLPADAYEAHRSRPLKELHTRLQSATAEIKKFAHVNKKALDQYMSFAEQRDELMRRKVDNDGAEAKIRQMQEEIESKRQETLKFEAELKKRSSEANRAAEDLARKKSDLDASIRATKEKVEAAQRAVEGVKKMGVNAQEKELAEVL